MTFESLTLTPLYGDTRCKIMDISMFLAVFLVRFWYESGKMCKNKSTFFFFTFFADIPCFFCLFFSPGRNQLLGSAGQENIGPCISPLHEFWITGLEALLELVDTAGPKVWYQGQY